MDFELVDVVERECPYLAGRRTGWPMYQPIVPVTPERFDALLAQGYRRTSATLFRNQCPGCAACEQLRLPIARFRPSKSQRRVWRRSAGEIRIEVGPPQVSPQHLDLFQRHERERGLGRGGAPLTEAGYRHSFVRSCVSTQEVRYLLGDRLVAVSLLDVGRRSASSMYHYFDPQQAGRSLGVFSVLMEVELLRRLGFEWLYLGQYVAGCQPLAYKVQYHPHQRLQAGTWREFEKGQAEGRVVPTLELSLAPRHPAP